MPQSNMIERRPRSLSKILLATIAPVLVSLSLAPAHAQSDWDKVVAAAKAEGKLVLYKTTSSEAPAKIAERFKARYGIDFDVLSATPSQLRERVRSEQASGRFLADVVVTGGTIRNAAPLFEAHGALPNANRIKPPMKDDGTFLPSNVLAFGILVNTNMVKPGDEPRTWKDLADPKWKGKILADDPRAVGPGNGTHGALLQKFGKGYLESLAKQNIEFTREINVSLRRVAQGEYPIFISFAPRDLVKLQGLPVKGIMLGEGAPYTEVVSMQAKNAPHPNVARLFLNFILEDEAQNVYATEGQLSVTGYISADASPELRALLGTPLLGTIDDADLNAVMAQLKAIYP